MCSTSRALGTVHINYCPLQAGYQAEPEQDGGAPNLPVIVQKNNREDVTERFGKFEIKQELESK